MSDYTVFMQQTKQILFWKGHNINCTPQKYQSFLVLFFTPLSRDKGSVCRVRGSDNSWVQLLQASNEWPTRQIDRPAFSPWPWPGGLFDWGSRNDTAWLCSSSRSSSLRSGSTSYGPTSGQTPSCCSPWRCRDCRWPSWWCEGCSTCCAAGFGWRCREGAAEFWGRAFADDPAFPWQLLPLRFVVKSLKKQWCTLGMSKAK